jgi:internalin A
MKQVFAVAIISALLLQSQSTSIASAQQQQVKSFAQWCQQRNSVSVAIRHTINVLLEKSGTKNCQQADAKLRILKEIKLDRSQIVDLQHFPRS